MAEWALYSVLLVSGGSEGPVQCIPCSRLPSGPCIVYYLSQVAERALYSVLLVPQVAEWALYSVLLDPQVAERALYSVLLVP